MVVTLPLPRQIVEIWPQEMVSFLMWFAFWSFAGLLTIPWLFCVYYLVTHQLGRTKRIKQLLDEDSAPKVVIVMPCYQEELDVLITAIDSVVECDYPPSCVHVFLSFDGDEEGELYLNTIEKLGVPLTLESYPKSIDVAYKDARITVSRFPHGGKRNCQKATFKLIDRVYSEYLKRNDNLFILFIDSDCILDRHCLQNFLYDMEFSPGNERNMLAMTGVITSTTKKHSVITLLQDMEYIHGQLFERTVESGCGTVTCLPGALTMLRFSAFRRMAKYYFADKAETCSDLFDFAKDHLGEDRYLTHLFMIGAKKRYQIQMCTSAFCKTEAVQTYASLVKQRRRWFLGFITNEACMLTDWRLWRRYPILLAYRFFQNTIRTTALLFFIMVLALLSTEKSIADLPVGFIAISLGLNWLMMGYFGAKLRRYKIWLYPVMFVLNPFFNWYYMVYGIFTAGQRTWGGPRADAGAADKHTTVQEAIEHAEQTGDDLNVVPETFIPAVIAQKEHEQATKVSDGGDGGERLLDRRTSRRRTRSQRGEGVLGRRRSVLQPPPQVEGLFAAPQRTAGGFYRYLDPAGDVSSGGSDELSSLMTTVVRAAPKVATRSYYPAGVPARSAPRPSTVAEDVELVRDSDTSTLAQQGSAAEKGKGKAPILRASAEHQHRNRPDRPVHLPSSQPAAPPPPSEDAGPDFLPRMSEEDQRKYDMAHAKQVSSFQQQRARLRPQAGNRVYEYLHPSYGGPEGVPMGEAGYAETLPGTPVDVSRAPSDGGAGLESLPGEGSAEWEARQGLMPSSEDGCAERVGSERSPLARRGASNTGASG
ncbi:unnamed protein product [Discula destructiva]